MEKWIDVTIINDSWVPQLVIKPTLHIICVKLIPFEIFDHVETALD